MSVVLLSKVDDSIAVVADVSPRNYKILSTAVRWMSSSSSANIPRITFSECEKYAFRCSTFIKMSFALSVGNWYTLSISLKKILPHRTEKLSGLFVVPPNSRNTCLSLEQWWRTLCRPSAQMATLNSRIYSKVPTRQFNANGPTEVLG